MTTQNAFCPENHYFGAHPGDGADFGVWQCEDCDCDVAEDEQTDEDRADSDEVFFCGKFLGKFPKSDEAFAAIREAMEKAQYWPNIYSVNDHGNVTLHDSKGNHIRDWV